MFYGQHGVENTFNLENGLGVRFEFDLKDTHKLGFSTEPSYLKMRYICIGKNNYHLLRILFTLEGRRLAKISIYLQNKTISFTLGNLKIMCALYPIRLMISNAKLLVQPRLILL